MKKQEENIDVQVVILEKYQPRQEQIFLNIEK